MNLTMILKFSWRYFRAKKSTKAINIISWVSVVAIMFSTASLIIILSAFNGFESLVKSLYSSFYPELRIGPEKGKTINLTVEQLNQLRGIPGVTAFTLVAKWIFTNCCQYQRCRQPICTGFRIAQQHLQRQIQYRR